MKKTFPLFLLALLALAGCGPRGGVTEETASPATLASKVRPTDLPSPQPTAEPSPTTEPESTIPRLVWLPFSSGTGESGVVLAVRRDWAGLESSPVDFELYWDYSGATGKLAYGSRFWQAAEGSDRSVSDLWVYDYGSGEAAQWLPDNVGRASWSPDPSAGQRLAAAIYDPQAGRYDLALVRGPGRTEVLAACASPYFAWSPDGLQIAYTAFPPSASGSIPDECQGAFVVSVSDKSVARLSDQLSFSISWIGDRPIWADEALLFSGATPESVFWVIPLDGSGAFQPQLGTAVAEEYLPSPLHAFWSSAQRSLIGQTEDMTDPFGVWVYAFSEDLRTIEQAYRVNWGEYRHELVLVDWWEPGESVLLRDITNISDLNPFGVAVVWSLADRTAAELAGTGPDLEVPLYPAEARTGDGATDRVIEAFLSQDPDRRLALTRTLTTGCSTTPAFVGPPPCGSGQAEGTPVEVFPHRRYRATQYAAPDGLGALLDFPLAGLYAAYRVPQGGFDEDWWPAGEVGLMFASPDGDQGVEVIVEGAAVVRIEFWPLTPLEVLQGAEIDYLLPPLSQ